MRQRKGMALWILGLVCLSLIFISVAATNLDNYFPVSADDGWIMSASYKVAREGVFGSDLYAGFFHADRRYFIALPVHHLLQAISFRLFGFGVAQARLPGLLGALFLIWTTSILTYRLSGWRAALLAAALLVLWRTNLVATEPRPTLLAYAHSGRYDVTAAAFVWFTVLLLDAHRRRPWRVLALAMGVCAGLATLTQFFGAFVLPLLVVVWTWESRRGGRPLEGGWLTAAGFLSVTLPYLIYVLAAPADFRGQAALKGARVGFDQISFYLGNLWREGNRYAWLIERQLQSLASLRGSSLPGTMIHDVRFGPWVLILGLPLVIAGLVRRARPRGSGGYLPLLALSIFLGGLALFDRTKAPVYSIILVPGLTIVFAQAFSAGFSWRLRRPGLMRLVPAGVILLTLLIVAIEGAHGYLQQRRIARNVTVYASVAERIEAELPQAPSILAAERWWPALHHYPYLALNNLWTRWRIRHDMGDAISIRRLVAESGANAIIVNNNVRGDLRSYPQPLQQQFWAFLADCALLSAEWHDHTYGHIEVFRLVADCLQ